MSYFQNKKGVSVIIGYVLLVVMALGLGVGVYTYLSALTPKDKPECKNDIHIILVNYTCSAGNLEVNLQNKGLFRIDAAYVRIGGENQKVKDLINNEDVFFGVIDGQKGLSPGKTITQRYINPIITQGTLGLEIQPAVFDKNDLAICESAVITQPVECTAALATT